MSSMRLGLFLFLCFASSAKSREEVVRLPNEFNINPKYITLSGFSSGGTFAQHMYLSYASLFRGLAVFSHTYYRCGPIDPRQEAYDLACTTIGNESTFHNFGDVFTEIHNYVANGLIEDPRTLKNKPLYVWTGLRNWLLRADMSLKIVQLFEPFIQNPHVIRTVVQDGNLTMPTNNPHHPPCASPTNDILVNNCGRSGAFEALQWMLGTNAVRHTQPKVPLQPLLSFDQTEFFYGIGHVQPLMHELGYLYVPKICRQGGATCHLHFYFHGCNVSREFVGSKHIEQSGFLEVAEANGIIMVFPQTRASLYDELGCWDTHGITGQLYATRRGTQVTVVRNMLSRLLRQEEGRRVRGRDVVDVHHTSVRTESPFGLHLLRNIFGGVFSSPLPPTQPRAILASSSSSPASLQSKRRSHYSVFQQRDEYGQAFSSVING